MKTLLGILGIVGGLVVSLGMFVGGLAFATSLLTAEPKAQPGPSVDVADLWTAQPRKVDTAAQRYERIPALQIPSDPNPSAEAQIAATVTLATTDLASAPVDAIETASVQTAASEDRGRPASEQLPTAHVEWCANKYRSYRPEDNSYTPYSGGRRPCVSPYSNDVAVAERVSPARTDADSYAELVDDPSAAAICFDRCGRGQLCHLGPRAVLLQPLSLVSARRQYVPASRRRPAQAVPLT